MTDGFETLLLQGVAGVLAGTRRTKITYRPAGAYQATDGFGIYFDIEPEGGLDAITLTEYAVSDPIDNPSVAGVQARIASQDRRQVKSAISDMYDLLHGRWGGSLGEIKLIQSVRQSGTGLGQDGNGRLVRTENYYLTIERPAPFRY